MNTIWPIVSIVLYVIIFIAGIGLRIKLLGTDDDQYKQFKFVSVFSIIAALIVWIISGIAIGKVNDYDKDKNNITLTKEKKDKSERSAGNWFLWSWLIPVIHIVVSCLIIASYYFGDKE